MILVDTSVWIDHLRRPVGELADALGARRVTTHPFVIGELACGQWPGRELTLHLLHHLPRVAVAAQAEVLGFIDRRKLAGRGLGFIDMHLLAAALFSVETTLWTRDKRLAAAAREVGVAAPA